jgi:hypothetical protein
MKLRLGSALLLFGLLGASVGNGQQQTHNGYWWVDADQQFKLGFATGYAMAMNDTADAAALRCLAARNGGTVPEKYPGDEALMGCMQSPEVASLTTFNNLRVGQLVDGVDEFYKDFRNKNIQIELAMRYVRDELNGKTDKELADELAGWRRTANK